MLIMVVLIGGTGGTTMTDWPWKTNLANTGPTGRYHLCSTESRGVPPVPPVPPKNEGKRPRLCSRTLDPLHDGEHAPMLKLARSRPSLWPCTTALVFKNSARGRLEVVRWEHSARSESRHRGPRAHLVVARLLRTAHWPGQPLGSVEITHPFHPLRGHQFVVGSA
jgi:hypothetical protein